MTRDEYGEWAKRHGKLFGFGFANDWDMLISWFEVLDRYDVALLNHATDDMSKSTVPINPLRNHLATIQQFLRNYTAVTVQREWELARDVLGVCVLCGNSGYVTVPWLRVVGGEVLGVNGDQWQPVSSGSLPAQFTTMAVTCTCAVGRRVSDTFPANKRPMSLDTYQRLNPHWRGQLARRRLEVQQSQKSTETPAGAEWAESWKEEMRRRWGLRQPGDEVEAG